MSNSSRKIQIAIIDDSANIYSEWLSSKISCDVHPFSNLNEIYTSLKLKELASNLAQYDLIFFDCTFETDDQNYSAVQILEQLINENPDFREKCIVMIGSELNYTKDPRTLQLIRLAKELPHRVYTSSKPIEFIYYIIQKGTSLGIPVEVLGDLSRMGC